MLRYQRKTAYNYNQIPDDLVALGYHRVPLVLNAGDFSVRGSIIDIFPTHQNLPIRLEFFDDDLEDIRSFEPNTQRSLSTLDDLEVDAVDDERLRQNHVIPHELLFELKEGDAVVHIHHGVGRYLGLERLKLQDFEGEYAVVEYQHNDRIFVPIEQLTRIYKYTGTANPVINSLRDEGWQKVQKRVKKAVKNVAKDLLTLYKTRAVRTGFAFQEASEVDLELERSFPFEPTVDQQRAIDAVTADMESIKPMDRLVCGDVGFGKTEVAIRAALKAVVSHKQVAILAPTTLLTRQHHRVLSQRLESLGVTVEFINRFKTRKEQRLILERLASGRIDILIGTHRLLQPDVTFADLGLLIIDEEQQFGVMAKEKIKQLRLNVDVLTLSATPLPRTLYLSISGIRDISVINTPPRKRLSVITEVQPFDLEFIREKVQLEIARGGQVFFLHNRVNDMLHLQHQLKSVMPNLDVRAGHGQMHAHELEAMMVDFYDNKFPVLLATTIIENGIDIPNVHTIFIDQADRFGLAQLHQLRGRVGRDQTQSYCYLMYHNLSILRGEVQARFDALIQFATLGSGYDIALRDLEIRGIGNILGTEQSGYMEAVGFELYMHLLNEAIAVEKGGPSHERPQFQLSTRTESFIPEEYIPDMIIRLAVYKRIADIKTKDAAILLRQECADRFGELPDALDRMLRVIEGQLG